MTTHIALLRGVNLAGKKMVAMAELRAWLGELGFQDVQTLLQSGNVVFRGGRRSGASLEAYLEAEAEKALDLATSFMVRTAEEWAGVIARNPFPDVAKKTPAQLLVSVLKGAPDAAAIARLAAAVPGRERATVVGRELYLVYPDGVGASKLTAAIMDRALGVRGTARNWNTVLKLGAVVSR